MCVSRAVTQATQGSCGAQPCLVTHYWAQKRDGAGAAEADSPVAEMRRQLRVRLGLPPLRRRLQTPDTRDLATATGGRRFGTFTRVVIIVYWGSLLPYFLLATADSFKLIGHTSLCQWQWSLVTAALLLIPAQLQTLHQISYLTAPSSLAIVVALALCFAGILGDDRPR